MTDPWRERLSEFLDGELPPGEHAEAAAHLAKCAECTATLAELRLVVDRARSLEYRSPAEDLWPGIAARIGAADTAVAGRIEPGVVRERRRRRVSFSIPELAAAAVILMLVSGGGVWLARRGAPEPQLTPVADSSPAAATLPARTVAAGEASFTGGQYAAAIADLERALAEGRGRLAPATLQTLEENVRIIDGAIEDASRALAVDPANVYLNGHLAATMRRKVELLRWASEIIAQT